MLLIPGIIIKDGKAVYVKDVKSGDTDVISTEPAEVAKTWVENGAMRVHVVDFDGIKTGKASNAAIINEITEAVGDVPVQIRGGIRDEETVQSYLEAGIEYVVIGTRAVSAPHFVQDICLEYPGHIMVGLDIKEDKVAAEGWSKLSNQDIGKLAENFQRDGVEGIVYTEIGAGNAA
ncbi:MAG: HisA/HisF-related TIM barrel protein, partial [Gammaproteobacteria bacterium]|nr:HisA/HisF-related TIM barrel protein [Gammaproteobacteria bacterium]